MNFQDIDKIKKLVRAVNYLTVTQIYLKNNYLLKNQLEFSDIKPRLLGHWGTCPGINFVYAHLNSLIKEFDLDVAFVLGSGHGFPALQAHLFVEQSLKDVYPEATHTEGGIEYISKKFSWPYGFPSHSNPGAPGVILEGGELGHSLSVSYGAVLDNPNLIVTCLIGDGEAETGPLSSAWHLNKFLDPLTNGVVLPILHLNGYKISGPTIFGRMSMYELNSLFSGYGYEPLFVEEIPGEDIHKKMFEILRKAYLKIRNIKDKASNGEKIISPNWPMIILKSPKGWTGPKEFNGLKIEDNHYSHQVVASEASSNIDQLRLIEEWLKSYRFDELFDTENGFCADIMDLIPEGSKRMGSSEYFSPLNTSKILNLPNINQFSEEVTQKGIYGSSSMRRLGEYLNEIIKTNDNFRIFSPDETYSNKIDKVFESTKRSFVWPLKDWDKDFAQNGKVIEILNEHALFGMLQGYVLTGRQGLFVSYEAFVQIVASMADQYLKFIKISKEFPWRSEYASMNIILTSSGWRQDHNGFSHQNPGFVSNMLEKEDPKVNVYFPPDGATTLASMQKSLISTNGLNLIVAGKTLEPRWFTATEAEELVENHLKIFNPEITNPDFVFIGIGDYVSNELMAAKKILEEQITDIKIKFVHIINLKAFERTDIDSYLDNVPTIINFHGYPATVKKYLYSQKNNKRFEVRGYIENGSTTTPYDMHVRNHTSRWHIILWVFEKLLDSHLITQEKFDEVTNLYNQKFSQHLNYIIENGVDLPEITEFKYTKN